MLTITIQALKEFTPSMERLRRHGYQGFHNSTGDNCSMDEFDNFSLHITAVIANSPVGMIRLTQQPPSVLHSWATNRISLPFGDGVVDLTRGVTDEGWRGKNIYKLLMLETMIKAKQLGAEKAIAGISPNFLQKPFLQEIGFVDVGNLVILSHAPIGEGYYQPIVQNINENYIKTLYLRDSLIGKMLSQGINVELETQS